MCFRFARSKANQAMGHGELRDLLHDEVSLTDEELRFILALFFLSFAPTGRPLDFFLILLQEEVLKQSRALVMQKSKAIDSLRTWAK